MECMYCSSCRNHSSTLVSQEPTSWEAPTNVEPSEMCQKACYWAAQTGILNVIAWPSASATSQYQRKEALRWQETKREAVLFVWEPFSCGAVVLSRPVVIGFGGGGSVLPRVQIVNLIDGSIRPTPPLGCSSLETSQQGKWRERIWGGKSLSLPSSWNCWNSRQSEVYVINTWELKD